MSKLTLADLREKVDGKFEPFEIILEQGDKEVGQKDRVLRLRHLMRLSKEVRTRFSEIQTAKDAREKELSERSERVKARKEALEKLEECKASGVDKAAWPVVPELEEHDEDEVDYYAENMQYFSDVFMVVGDNPAYVQEFLDEVDDDMAFLAYVFAEWAKKTNPGEAQSSDS